MCCAVNAIYNHNMLCFKYHTRPYTWVSVCPHPYKWIRLQLVPNTLPRHSNTALLEPSAVCFYTAQSPPIRKFLYDPHHFARRSWNVSCCEQMKIGSQGCSSPEPKLPSAGRHAVNRLARGGGETGRRGGGEAGRGDALYPDE